VRPIFLDFEQSVAELEGKIEELRLVQSDSAVDISEEISRLKKKSDELTKDIYSKLTSWQVSQVARHQQRPYTQDYINEIFTDFHELHGDRNYADDLSIVGGLARFDGQACMVIGHQKGRDTKERAMRNFGMPRPEGLLKSSNCQYLRLSIHRAHIRASAQKSAVNPKRLVAIYLKWRNSIHRSSPRSLVKAVRAARWRLRWPIRS
jgi:acetyl-CoA carboxylase carboxyl transferase subunit alpha